MTSSSGCPCAILPHAALPSLTAPGRLITVRPALVSASRKRASRFGSAPPGSAWAGTPEPSDAAMPSVTSSGQKAPKPQSSCQDQTVVEKIEVHRRIAASPAAIFAVLCDPQGHVAIDSSGMLQDAEGASVAAAVDS